MAVITYPLNNLNFSAEDVGIYNSTRTTGIFAGDDFSATMTGNDNTITVGAGMAWMRLQKFFGVAVAMKEQTAVDMGLPDTNYPRIDAIVLQFDANKNSTELVAKKGTASSSPQPPAVTRTEAVHEIHLYQVRREPSATAITASKVTDLRLNAAYCGLMADAVTSVDTATINAQITALIRQLEDDLKDVEDQTYYASKSYVNTSVSQAAPVNLLDNSDFTNLVAQAGIGNAHGSQAYAADRWILDNGSVTYTKGTGLTLNGTIRQKLEKAPSVGSVFVETVSGTAEISYSSGAVTVTSDGGVLKWAALYEGEYTAETLPEYRPKGYTNELLECKRYFQRISGGVAAGYITAAGEVGMFLPMDVPTRIKPTVTMLIDSYAYFGNGLAEKVTEITPVLNTNGILLTGKLGYAPGSLAPATFPDLNMNLSADL